MSRKTVDLIYFNAGGGHKASTLALKESINRSYDWNVNMVDLREVLEPLDWIKKHFHFSIEDFYNNYTQLGWTYGSGLLLRTLQFTLGFMNEKIREQASKYWHDRDTDLVVSLIPNFNRPLYKAIRQDRLLPYVTVMLDLADCPPHFWQEKNQDAYMVCGSEKSYRQAFKMGYKSKYIYRTSGMMVHPKFYDKKLKDVEEERKKLGLFPNTLTALVSFGRNGSNRVRNLWQISNALNKRVQFIFICGRNEELYHDLMYRTASTTPFLTVGFTEKLPYYMDLADFFIGKPGPGSLSEALIRKLPVFLESDSRTMIQEKYNVQWVTKAKMGVGGDIYNLKQINSFLAALEIYRKNVQAFRNTAIFEVPKLLESILEKKDVRIIS